MTDVPGFSGDGRPVVLLTLREAQAIRTALPTTLDTEDSDLGREYRVLRDQIEWCMQPRVLRKHAKKAS